MEVMAKERIRMWFDCDERLRRAIRIFAGARGIDTSDAIEHLLSPLLTDEIEQANRIMAKEAKKPPKPQRPD